MNLGGCCESAAKRLMRRKSDNSIASCRSRLNAGPPGRLSALERRSRRRVTDWHRFREWQLSGNSPACYQGIQGHGTFSSQTDAIAEGLRTAKKDPCVGNALRPAVGRGSGGALARLPRRHERVRGLDDHFVGVRRTPRGYLKLRGNHTNHRRAASSIRARRPLHLSLRHGR